MSRRILLLRPDPTATAAAARALGLDPVAAPLFAVRPLGWDPPDPAGFDAVLLTSANAARLAGAGLTPFLHLPCRAVGEATAAAARSAGFREVEAGGGDGAAALAGLAGKRVFHPCGREHVPLPGVERRIVYAAEAAGALPDAAGEALQGGALVLLHSPRAAALFAALADQAGLDRARIRIAAISPAAAEAAGSGWAEAAAASAPRDAALLELAAELCEKAP